MSVKSRLVQSGMKLAGDPAILKLFQDERVIKGLMALTNRPGQVNSIAEEQAVKIAKYFGLATTREVQDLRRMVRSLEDEITELRGRVAQCEGRH